MRILIQNAGSKAYYDGQTWDYDLINALDFESTSVAEKYCLEHNLTSAIIVVKFKDDEDDIKFPAGSRSSFISSRGWTAPQ